MVRWPGNPNSTPSRTKVLPFHCTASASTGRNRTSATTSLSASSLYLDWLHGRSFTERDRAPGYNRIKAVFAQRLFADTQKKARLPTPAWVHA